ncbi:2-oxoglutarate dehydrogenase, putative [Bodo saltans]|uniref:2-oxoglutarate dehydrogenase, mitochondrial n=1 Tax=Bodo saltans TaxID=75058 RepID=A0A0S4JV11_BODSA|nr:2-oxoglutarate dehydrogenase, putative [Bodo saltans]|eukprot:CUG93885.1 2-oxoglutarate dehydrogenase, putative [Bodo saltans]
MMRRALQRVSSRIPNAFMASTSATVAVCSSTAVVSSMRCYTDAKTVRAPHVYEQFVASSNSDYVESLLKQYRENKANVDETWWPILENLDSAAPDQALIESFQRPEDQDLSSHLVTEKDRVDNMRLAWMVRAYETVGHSIATLDPLGLYEADLDTTIPVGLEPSRFGFKPEDMDRSFFATFGGALGQSFQQMVTGTTRTPMKLRDIVAKLRQLHCGNIGFEFMNSGYLDLRNWFRAQVLSAAEPLPAKERKEIYEDVVKACGLEQFLHRKYSTLKRFGLDGAEALVPALNATLSAAANSGVETVTLGMPHRGRINVLVNVCGKPLKNIFNEFEGKTAKEDVKGTGDVKYHLGIHSKMTTRSGKELFVNLLANPSHLEAVNPLVLGKTRARQVYTKDTEMNKNLPILLHGDAAFAGQGPCYEVMGLCELENYHVGGTIHIVVNNQVGFTTDPVQSRSSRYCTDLSRVCNAPVLHVNADDVDAVVKAARIAFAFRKEFKRDAIIDLVCYRRYGHNESDVPDFTQPLMYDAIRKHQVLVDLQADKLVREGVMSKEEVLLVKKEYESVLRKEFDEAANDDSFIKVKSPYEEANSNRYTNILEMGALRETGVAISNLKKIGEKLTAVPEGFTPHPTIAKNIAARRAAVESGSGVEWCLAEALAFGASALEGIHVRLSGQDVERGTFTQRHAVWTDYNNGEKHCSLTKLGHVQAPVVIANSSLSEFAVSGFEMGYSMENPKSLVIWEAQFGDFSNGAQVIWDQFLASAESKWTRQCGLAISLPHGYSGAGPEHSSARVERFLQLSDDPDTLPAQFSASSASTMLEARAALGNWQVCYPSTPANYYHMLRRQTHREFRKPLIFCFSKARLRAPNVSSLEEMAVGTFFLPVIDTGAAVPSQVRKVVFCSGQIESICADYRAKKQSADTDSNIGNDVVFVKLEQIAPFPWEHIGKVINKYHGANPATQFVWLQEEPKNMGMWDFVRPRFQNLLRHLGVFAPNERLTFIGRETAASPATGYGGVHKAEEDALVQAVFA